MTPRRDNELVGVAAVGNSVDRTAIWSDYLNLIKPEITFLVAISSLAGFILGANGSVNGLVLLASTVGITLTSAGACSLNQYLERDSDRRMKRTAQRPLPAGRMEPRAGLIFGSALIIVGLSILCPLTNPITAILALICVVLYLFVYTPIKKRSWTNTIVGAVPGALPILGGYTAASNQIDLIGLTLFGILFFWQIPHFYAIAWMYKDDYQRGDYIMLPEKYGSPSPTTLLAVSCASLTMGLTLVLGNLAALSTLYLAVASVLGFWFVVYSVRFHLKPTGRVARDLLKASVVYIPVFVALLLVDALV